MQYVERDRLDEWFRERDGVDVVQVLVMGGSFNPPHTMHRRALALCRDWLESRTDPAYLEMHGVMPETSYGVICVMVPSSDEYVRAKLGRENAIPLEHRVAMCNILAGDDLSLFVWSEGNPSAGHVRGQVCELLQRAYPSTRFIATSIGGGDHAAKYSLYCRDMIIVGRPGYDEDLEELMEEDKHRVHAMFRLLTDDSISSVSSTDLRARFAALDVSGDEADGKEAKECERNESIPFEMLPPEITAYIIRHRLLPLSKRDGRNAATRRRSQECCVC